MPEKDVLKVYKIYKSLQEEGPFYGSPAIFLKLLTLPTELAELEIRTPEQVGLEIALAGLNTTNYLVINDGEPLWQWDSLIKLYHYIPPTKIEIQTNGAIFDAKKVAVLSGVHRLYYAVTPNSSAFSKEWTETDIPNISIFYKFPVSNEKDVIKVSNFAKHYGIDTSDIYLTPDIHRQEEIVPALTTIFKLAVRYNMKVSPRMHILDN